MFRSKDGRRYTAQFPFQWSQSFKSWLFSGQNDSEENNFKFGATGGEPGTFFRSLGGWDANAVANTLRGAQRIVTMSFLVAPAAAPPPAPQIFPVPYGFHKWARPWQSGNGAIDLAGVSWDKFRNDTSAVGASEYTTIPKEYHADIVNGEIKGISTGYTTPAVAYEVLVSDYNGFAALVVVYDK